MRLGIDIDNVISNMDNELLKEYIKHDKELRNTGIINENSRYIRKGMFDWSEEEDREFYYSNIERIAKNFKPISNSKETIDKLKADGNEIYIITGRDNGEYSEPRKLTEDWLKKYKIYYDRLILTNAYNKSQKSEECIKHNIDIMIEDSISTCIKLKENNIKVLTMNTRFNKYDNSQEFERVNNWNEIYNKIADMYPKKIIEKINVILDTDTYNECDDQFAVSYLLKSQDRFNIEAITIAPYQHDNSLAIEEGQEKSYNEVLKICKWLNFNTTNKVFKGAEDYICNGYNECNDAVNKIIEIALKNDKTYILAIGAITNVALAIKKEPKILEKIEVIWLGGHSLLPCKNVASNLRTSIYELNHHLKDKNQLCNYLIDRFYNDGYHGIQERRVIWDISVIAYMINKNWFTSKEVSCPNINDDTSYELTTNNHKITMINYIDVNKVFSDLFGKLGE